MRTTNRDCSAPSNRRLAFTLIEVLMAVAITGVLMVAIATALSNAINVTNGNVQSFQSQQAGRVALTLLTTKIRRANEVHLDPSATAYPTAAAQVDVPDLTLVSYQYDPSTNGYNQTIQTAYHYHFDSANQQLQLTTEDSVSGTVTATTGPMTILGNTTSLKLRDLHFIATPEADPTDAVHPLKFRYVTIKTTLATNPGTAREALTVLEGSAYSRLLALN
jgi:prepilin-type N-terminal cleavage/methylation domain-containing protein